MSATQVRTTQPRRRAQDDAARVLNAALLQFDLAGEIRKLRQEDSWRHKAGRSAATLVKHGDLRLVLVAMRANSHMREHKASARISIQTLPVSSGYDSVKKAWICQPDICWFWIKPFPMMWRRWKTALSC